MGVDRSQWEEYWGGEALTGGDPSWLTPWLPELVRCRGPILEMGCGGGGDTVALAGIGRPLVAVDFSQAATVAARRRAPRTLPIVSDFRDGLPFATSSFGAIVAGLSLHYFDDATTRAIMRDAARCLVERGLLIARVNSTHDMNYGARSEVEVERHLWSVDGMLKRFFDKADVTDLFGSWLDLEHVEHVAVAMTPVKWAWLVVGRRL